MSAIGLRRLASRFRRRGLCKVRYLRTAALRPRRSIRPLPALPPTQGRALPVSQRLSILPSCAPAYNANENRDETDGQTPLPLNRVRKMEA